MADIELVIKIPEEDFKKICANKEDTIIAHDTCRRIANVTPLPKGHGKLIDADVLKRSWNGIETSVGYRKVIDFQVIDDVTPIIEADKGE